MNARRPSYLGFGKEKYAWKSDVDYRAHPELYRVGKGEQGVLICQPYKSVIGPLWRFKNPDIALESAEAIYELFSGFMDVGDFVGADLARKYLQMGYTRARRYANYKGGRKYDKANDYAMLERGTGEQLKAGSAAVFYDYWQKAEDHPGYKRAKADWKKAYG
ncbi:cytoplasmic protein [Pedobacter kyungheensis]|uniref:Cytoplasmic protein n=1 Tax=Pedobacter kyungheensis TaxID=1069985 RepID=A0A0C1FY54_9SPHI|nr:cytoplasmic protein [Pedobacter kyungheensis]